MSNYLVVSSAYETISSDWYEPPEFGSDVCLVINAKTENEAKWWAVQNWRLLGYKCLYSDEHPLKGVTAKRVKYCRKNDFGRDCVVVRTKR